MDTNQKIKKSDLKVIYNSVCGDWQKKLQEILLWSEGKEVEISEELIQQGYKEANNNQKKLIEKYFKIEAPKSIINQIKDINDVYKILGIKRNLPYKTSKTKEEKCLNAAYDLLNIAKAYNGDWVPNWENNNEKKWFIYKYFSGGVFYLFVVCYYDPCCGYSSGLHFQKKEHCEDIKVKFKNILEDYFMI